MFQLQDFERIQLGVSTDELTDAFDDLQLGSTSLKLQQTVQPERFDEKSKISESIPQKQASPLPTLPTAALSLEELERKIMEESQATIKAQQPTLTASPGQERFSHPPPGFPQNMPPGIVPHMGVSGMPMMPPMGFPQMAPMMPPPNMPLPKLPPLHPQFLPVIPIWLNAIVNNIQLPMGAPPPPPFLFQLLNYYRVNS